MRNFTVAALMGAVVSAQYTAINVVENHITNRNLFYRTDEILPVN